MVATTMPIAWAVIGLVSSTVSLRPNQTTFVITNVVPPTTAKRTSSRCLMTNARRGAGKSLNTNRTTLDTPAVYGQPPERVHPVTLSARLTPFGLAVAALSKPGGPGPPTPESARPRRCFAGKGEASATQGPSPARNARQKYCQQNGQRGSSSGRHSPPGSLRPGGGVLDGGLVVDGGGVVVVVVSTGGGAVVVSGGLGVVVR